MHNTQVSRLVLGSVAAILLLLVPAAAAQSEWIGSYSFYEDGGKTAGGSVIFIAHELEIFDAGEGLVATIKSNGYQTSRDLVGKARIEGSKLMIYFESYGDDNVLSQYKEGDLLLTLERKTSKGKEQIVTLWAKFTPVLDTNLKSGKTYFTKSENEIL